MLSRTVDVAWLEYVLLGTLERSGMSSEHRRDVANGLLFASLRGIDTHGITLFRTYLQELNEGRANIHPTFVYRQRRSAIVHLDADRALGMVAGYEAARKAMSLAATNGVGVVVVSNSNHFGAASIYTNEIARANLVGLAMSNSDALVLPTNGSRALLGTNPISVAVRGDGSDVFSADLATSQGSFLRSLARRLGGNPIPPGVLADAQGFDCAETSRDPVALFPLGGYKGQALGMIVSVFCALLADAAFDWDIANLFDARQTQPRDVSHFVLALDPSSVTDAERFRARLSEYLRTFRSSPGIAATPVCCPGDAEAHTAQTRAHTGIPLSQPDYDFFQSLASRGA